MSLKKHLLIRLLATIVPLLLLYGYAQIAFEANRNREHRTDAGLGIAFLLFFILTILFIGFMIDLIVRYRKKEFKVMLLNLPFLIPLLLFVSYIACLITSRCIFCEWLIGLMQKIDII